ncbi:hypothetical protein MFIFM68171_04030 [Madurella fahalii]|uniref:Uncharacterized protein n=1 Tax=Madurella fahalii TaxID=1157608 RepID=A0ABQ0G7T6_9PEZI
MASSLDSAASRPSSGVASPLQRMPSRSRTQSISSDRPSTVAHSLMSPPLAVSPEAAFIAASAASQIVTNDHDSHAETWYDQHGIEPSGDAVTVSPAALQLVNNFLDQLLFNFLSVSRSTTLSALRPAVSEVLKPKLAKDAINQADEELREYLGGDDEDSAQAHARDPSSPADWDLELAWKRTRLRCMVYSSLGDMEEEDEDYYMEQGHLDAGLDDRLSEAVSPAVAIFLTSILEFMGEQALVVAGQAAYHRMRLKYEKELKEGARSPTGVADRIIVEELDMERVALDRTLGRLWRAWKKKIRSPAISSMDRLTRSYSADSMRGAGGHMRSPSSAAEIAVPATVPEPEPEPEMEKNDAETQKEGSQAEEPQEEYLVAAGIPLPMGPDDVAEIEVPGLALCSDDEADEDDIEQETRPARPKSLMILPLSGALGLPTSTSSRVLSPASAPRKRSNSVPTLAAVRYVSPTGAQQAEQTTLDSAENSPTSGAGTPEVVLDVASDAGDEENRPTSRRFDLVPTEHAPSTTDDTEQDEMDDDDDDEVSVEEPRIIRSSRVSILGRSPSGASSDHGKPSAINTNLPVRTPSIHSARLIDVTSPRSPVVGPQRNSVVVVESIRQASPSRTSGTGTPPIPEDRPRHSPDSASGSRLTVNYGNKSGPAPTASVSETEETAENGYTVSPVSPATPASQTGAGLPTIPEPASSEQHEPAETTTQGPGPVGPVRADHTPAPSTPPKLRTKITILPATSSPASTASTTSGTFFIESMPVLPEGREVDERPRTGTQRYRFPQPPTLPERNAGRQAAANTSAHRQPATIGQVSVEHARGGSPSAPSSYRPHEPAAGQPRQQHPSGSPSSTKIKAVRTSEEGMQARIDVVRDFEELIQSDQTIQYTLTPESMRDIDSTRPIAPSSPVVSVKTRKSEDTRQNGDRSRSSSVARTSELKMSAPAHRPTGSGPRTVSETHHGNRNVSTGTGKHGGVVPRSTPPLPSKPRTANGPQPRDARLPRESLTEFAEFIRSTGPSGGRAASASASSGQTGPRNPSVLSKPITEPSRPSTTASNANRPKLQARDAAVDYKDDNSDLIDFIRRGPPSTSGNPRIPRAVAPFRTTMDSDQMSAAVGGKAVDAQLRDIEFRSSQASTNVTDFSVPPSVQSSVNSHSALLSRSKALTGEAGDGDMPIPKRKTRRVRDPYAIDVSDEELDEDDDDLMPKPKKRGQTQEESLIDFLNNYTPPPEAPVQPFNTSQARNKPKKKASAPSLMSRLTKRDSGQAGSRPASPRVSQLPAAESRSLNSRASAARGHIPIQVNIPPGLDQYAPPRTSSKAAAMMGGGGGPPMGGGPGGGGRVLMKKFEPREAISVPSRATSDLAEFLKNSGPPPGMSGPNSQFARPGSAEQDDANGISKMFGRRRKPSLTVRHGS